MNAQCNAPISDRFSSLCARVFYRRSAILKNRRGEGPGDEVAGWAEFPLLFKMVAPRALVFRPLVKGNDDSGNDIVH